MFFELAHTKLEAYKYARDLVFECYRVTKKFPPDERFALVQHIRRAAISVHLNLAEVCSRKSQKERNRYFEIARGSVIEIDAAMSLLFNCNMYKWKK